MKQKPFTIHFVCSGNTYRSRLAAAYMNTLISNKYAISSSGINTHENPVKTSQPYTQAAARKAKLKFEIDKIKTQTNNELLGQADVIVFMSKDVYDKALMSYSFDARKAVVWQIPDIDDVVLKAHKTLKEKDAIATQTLHTIKHHCNELWAYLSKTSWVDIVDEGNHLSDVRLPINWATDRGLWHRGVHVIAETSDGHYVVGKRSKSIVFSPGMLEITLGGGVDAGEHPLQAAQRETHEELGIEVAQKAFRPMFTYRQNAYHPHYRKRTRAHIYVYSVKLPLHSSHFRPQPGEVDEIRLLTKGQMKHLLKTHRMSHFGRLVDAYRLYRRAMQRGALPY